MTTQNVEPEFRITRGTGNVFADLGFPNATERQAKLRLVHVVNQLLDARKLSQPATASILKTTHSKVSALRRYKLVEFSVEALIGFLTALGRDVEVVIRPKPCSRRVGRITVRRHRATSCDGRS